MEHLNAKVRGRSASSGRRGDERVSTTDRRRARLRRTRRRTSRRRRTGSAGRLGPPTVARMRPSDPVATAAKSAMSPADTLRFDVVGAPPSGDRLTNPGPVTAVAVSVPTTTSPGAIPSSTSTTWSGAIRPCHPPTPHACRAGGPVRGAGAGRRRRRRRRGGRPARRPEHCWPRTVPPVRCGGWRRWRPPGSPVSSSASTSPEVARRTARRSGSRCPQRRPR